MTGPGEEFRSALATGEMRNATHRQFNVNDETLESVLNAAQALINLDSNPSAPGVPPADLSTPNVTERMPNFENV